MIETATSDTEVALEPQMAPINSPLTQEIDDITEISIEPDLESAAEDKETSGESALEIKSVEGTQESPSSEPSTLEHAENDEVKGNENDALANLSAEIIVNSDDIVEESSIFPASVVADPKTSVSPVISSSSASHTAKGIRVEDMISSSISQDLLKTFNLNDKFRFVRTIFGNSNDDFISTVNNISAMDSLSDVYDYLLNDRGFDIDDEEVKDFLSIVSNHFNDI